MKKILSIFACFALGFMLFPQTYTRDLSLQKTKMNGTDVMQLQEMLDALGFTEAGETDGWFGKKTKEALVKYQKYYGFKADGIMTKNVFDSLFTSESYLKKLFNYAIKDMNAMMSDKSLEKKEAGYEVKSSEGGSLIISQTQDGINKYAELGAYGSIGQSHYYLYKADSGNLLFCVNLIQYVGMMGEGGIASNEWNVYFIQGKDFYRIQNGNLSPDKMNDYLTVFETMKSYLK